jgi:hypothetical protein
LAVVKGITAIRRIPRVFQAGGCCILKGIDVAHPVKTAARVVIPNTVVSKRVKKALFFIISSISKKLLLHFTVWGERM